LRRIYGTSDFEHINYNIIEDGGERILAVDAVEKSWGPNYFRFGMGLSNDFNGSSNFTLEGLFRKTWMNSLGGEWVTRVQIGQIDAIQTQFYQRLPKSNGTRTTCMKAVIISPPSMASSIGSAWISAAISRNTGRRRWVSGRG
jgi:outer membrane translocation and assembly module TamA